MYREKHFFCPARFLNPSAKLDLHYSEQISQGDVSFYRDPVLLSDIYVRPVMLAFPMCNIQKGLVKFSLKFARIRPADTQENREYPERPM